MGGPWRARGFDPVAWRPPAARIEDANGAVERGGTQSYVGAIVIGYIASVVTTISIMLVFLRSGW